MKVKKSVGFLISLFMILNLSIISIEKAPLKESSPKVLLLTKIFKENNPIPNDNKSDSNELYREYYLGVIPNTANGSLVQQDQEAAYNESGQLSEQCLIVIDEPWYDIPERYQDIQIWWGVIGYLCRIKGGMEPILQTNIWNVSTQTGKSYIVKDPSMSTYTSINDTEFIKEWSDHAVNLTIEEPQDYFILSKEVNDYWSPIFDPNPDWVNNTYQNYLELCRNTTAEIHKTSPNTKIIIEFRMVTLNHYNQWDLVAQVNSSHCDVIGFTSYPYLLGDPQGTLYPSPQDLSDDYYLKILNYTDMPIAFTEIGWSTSNLTELPSKNFTGNEVKQADFVDIFFDQINQMPNIELVNWLYLHDISNKSEETHPNQLIGLKHWNGTKKLAYNQWDLISNRTYLNKTEVYFQVDLSMSDEMHVNGKLVEANHYYVINKSHAAMYWVVDAISSKSKVYHLKTGINKGNDYVITLTQGTLPNGEYTLRFIGRFEDCYTIWTAEDQLTVDFPEDEDEDEEPMPEPVISSYDIIIFMSTFIFINIVLIKKLKSKALKKYL